MSKHTPEPWFSDSEHVGSSVSDRLNDGWFAAKCLGPDRVENARRIVACVNACAGMEDPAAEIEKLRRQRDELLNLVKQARLEWLDQNQTSDGTDVVTPYDHVLYWGDC